MQTIPSTPTSPTSGRPGVTNGDLEHDARDVGPRNITAIVWYVTQIIAPSWNNDELLPWWKRWLRWFSKKYKHLWIKEQLELAERRKLLLGELWRDLPPEWHAQRLIRSWMPLSIYVTVERNFARILGTPERLFEAGMVAGYYSEFGGVWISRIFTLVVSVVRFICTVHQLFAQIIPRALYSLFNKNKELSALKIGWASVQLRTVYCVIDKQTGLRRDPLIDALSYVWWACGMTGSAGRFWGISAKVSHQLLQFDLMAFLRHVEEFIAEEIVEAEDGIKVNGELIAIRTSMQKHPELPFFTEPPDELGGSMTRPGWVVVKDIVVHTPPSKLHPEPLEWTVLKAGVRCSADAGCAISTYELRPPWWNPLFLVPFILTILSSGLLLWVSLAVFDFVTKWVRERDQQAQETVDLQLAMEARERQARLRYPDPDMQRVAELGQPQEKELEDPVALCIDLAGSSKRRKRFGAKVMLGCIKQYYNIIFDIILVYEKSRRTRGEVVVIWQGDAGDNAMLQFVGGTSKERLHTALLVAYELHRRIEQMVDADGEPFRVRIGIEQLGNTTLWSLEKAPCIIMGGGGENMNNAARLQEAAKRAEFGSPPRPTVLRKELADRINDTWEFATLGENLLVRDVDEEGTLTLVYVVGPKTA